MNKKNTQSDDSNILATPEEAFRAIEEDSTKAGGQFIPPEEYNGSVGRTMFDTPSSKDGTITVLMPDVNIDKLPNQALVRIKSIKDGRTYLGAIVEGPFAEPDGLRADATPLVVTSVSGGMLTPKFHGRAQAEILSEELEGGITITPRLRPKPNSAVFPLSADETARVLCTSGDIRLGLANGFEDLAVSIPNDKKVLPRHVGILGTTGGGKSTTVSGLIAKAQAEGIAVIIIDTEGEYCAINEPTHDPRMLKELEQRGLAPFGVPNTHIYHLVGRDTNNPKHPSKKQFSLRFNSLSQYAISEILNFNTAQEERFLKAYDITKIALERFKIWPVTPQDRQRLIELDELEEGYPEMKLAHLYDVVQQIACIKAKDPDPCLSTTLFNSKQSELKDIINSQQTESHIFSWRAVQGRLGTLKRLGVFDSQSSPSLNFKDMLQPGRVSILDLSDSGEPKINNLVIAELLRGVQLQQEENYVASTKAGKTPTPVVIFIEEAHEFLSDQRIKQMPTLFGQVARIARRGRKRWIGLVFITQLPQHLPDDVIGLINNWILHKIGDATILNHLKRSIGGINDAQWRHVLSLAPGQAICSFVSLTRPLQVSIDPTPCKLLMID